MLMLVHRMGSLDYRALMQIYEDSNRDNGKEFYPQEPAARQLELAEQDFYSYLIQTFFRTPGAFYALWQPDGVPVSALRLEPYKDGLLLSALETAPNCRRRGYAQALIRAVLDQIDCKRIYSHVGKRNRASLTVHEHCGFRRVSECALYLDGSANDRCCTLLLER